MGNWRALPTEPYNRCADNRLMMKYNNQLKKMPKIMSLNVRSFYGSLQGTINAPITGWWVMRSIYNAIISSLNAMTTCWHWEKRFLQAHQNELVNQIFRNFAWNDDVKRFFALWGRVEWAAAELNGIDTWECHIWHPWTLSFSKI